MLLRVIFFVLCLMLASVVSAQTEMPEPTPVTVQRAIFRIDQADYTEIELNQVAAIFEGRLSDIEGATVTVANATIVVDLPVAADAAVLSRLSQRGFLEVVDFTNLHDHIGSLEGTVIFTTGQAANDIGQTEATPEIMLHPIKQAPFRTVLTGDTIADAQAEVSQYGDHWEVWFELTPDGGATMGDHTRTHIGEYLAIVVDGAVLSAPLVQSEIGTSGVISSNFTQAEAEELALVLRSGMLPVPVVLESVEFITVTQ